MKYLRKRVGHDLEIVETNEQYLHKCARETLGKKTTQERVYFDDEFVMVVDENGLLNESECNFILEFPNNQYNPIQIIAGDVVFIRVKPYELLEEIYDYEVADVTDSDLEMVNKFLDEDTQMRLISKILKMAMKP